MFKGKFVIPAEAEIHMPLSGSRRRRSHGRLDSGSGFAWPER
jgi:hypothetical protein